ncbi:MAG: HisA/HisF-related TIM barrel protein, partial [Chloroflexota bacterium]
MPGPFQLLRDSLSSLSDVYAALRRGDLPAVGASLSDQDRIAVALDVRGGLAVGQGWVRGAAGKPVSEFAAGLATAGIMWREVTAIDRDGTMAGPDLNLLQSIARDPRIRVIASGGIRSANDLEATRRVGCTGAIVGRALYD